LWISLKHAGEPPLTEVFAHAPLIELVVEVRWVPPVFDQPDDRLDAFGDTGGALPSELFYGRLGSNLGAIGFTRSERTVPPGFPVVSPNTVLRYLAPGDTEGQVVYQVGPGVFAVNAIPPYKTWANFRPAVERGLTILANSWSDAETPEHFEKVILRYIDAFGDEFLEGSDRYAFITDRLGFKFELPPAISKHVESQSPSVFFQMTTPLSNQTELSIRTGEATVSNAPAVVLDMTVSNRSVTNVDVDDVLAVLDSGHEVINDIFVTVTQSVRHILTRGPQ
jgi:uncharacterized protein (TIGR04255 family)